MSKELDLRNFKTKNLICGDQDTVGATKRLYENLNSPQTRKLIENACSQDIVDMYTSSILRGDYLSSIVVYRFKTYLSILPFAIDQGYVSVAGNAEDYFFIMCVNHAINEKLKGVKNFNKITSIEMAKNAYKSIEDRHGDPTDYREYTKRDDNTFSFDNEYAKINVPLKNYNSNIELELPVVKAMFGRVKFATGVAVNGKLGFVKDHNGNQYEIPSYLWKEMIREGLIRNRKTSFNKDNTKRLLDGKEVLNRIDEILEKANLQILYTMPIEELGNVDDLDSGSDYRIVIHCGEDDIRYLKEEFDIGNDEEASYVFLRMSNGYAIANRSHKFYLAKNTGNDIIISEPKG